MDEARLMGNGILRYSTGDHNGWWCQIDARSDPAHQFGGKWSAWAWTTPIRSFAEFAARANFDTPEEALATLNSWLEPQGLRVLPPEGGFR